MLNFEIFINFMMISGLFVFISIRKHLLLTLMSLEYMVLVLFFLIYIFILIYGMEINILMVYLTFCICEGVLGLGILISLIRCHGNDMINSYSILLW
uniref:NADH-ubiquinone oxidoreductase chain 4L n=1 Tax=Hydrometra greeni TaxID=1492928 RepID=C5HIP6_9HEMI|nr:NADH dehydrogenase subunit 4L [Hydrometra greeni]ACJ69491.1 NADH dehydrogenase subunit 4L [Hydrometra greeni]